ncbi:hypothetical protein GW915_07400, partial [bacterium]|nr:hypothetical protein [bacterium]
LIHKGVEDELALLALQDKVRALKKLLAKDLSVAILIQNDPDPDAMASALALRKLVGRKAQTMPICSFDGRITRPENRAMAKLLDVEVQRVGSKKLAEFDRVVCVDCQPAFFKNQVLPKIHAILDHHPRSESCEILKQADFAEVRPELGSTATLMCLLLEAAKVEMSQRIATALLYGIKSDTLLLNREASYFDIQAFLKLYPKANTSLLKRIERPEIPVAYIKNLKLAFNYLSVRDSICVLPLGDVRCEDWIPQAADFAMQVEGARWGMAVGIFKDKVIVSGRNCGYVHHCGEMFKSIFGYFGSAGGHRSMAKAVVDKDRWVEVFGKNSLSQAKIGALLRLMLKKELQVES